jgi:hypothetical protein
MKSSTQILKVTKTIHIDEPILVLTFTIEETQALLALGGTSNLTRMSLLNKCHGANNSPDNNQACADLLSEIFFAASDFSRNQKLAGT